jgi:hypothetical protein
MNNPGPSTYMGFEIHPLVFLRRAPALGKPKTVVRSFDVAVRICRPGEESGSPLSRVFHIERKLPFEDTGDARRAAHSYGESIIDGKETGLSVKDL